MDQDKHVIIGSNASRIVSLIFLKPLCHRGCNDEQIAKRR